MKRKVAFAGASLLILGFLVGAAWRHSRMPPYSQVYALFSQVRNRLIVWSGDTQEEITTRQKKAMERLRSLGYLNARSPAEHSGVTKHNQQRAYQGLNLTTEGNTAEATLRDMDGEIVHQWRLGFEEIFPDRSEWPPNPQTCWRRVHLLPDGSLLAIFEGHSLVKIDRNSRLLWTYTGGAHHDLDVLPDGRIYCLARSPEMVREVNRDEPILNDYVVLLDPSGKELKRISILHALLNSPYKNFFFRADMFWDMLHTNTIEVLDGSLAGLAPAFSRGRLLLSVLKISTIAVLDPESETIVWASKDFTHYQHQPTVVGDGKLIVFDNQGDNGRSRVLEFNPVTQEITWSYDNDDGDLFSETLGSCQRLPNGNTLITESNAGRVIEVTPDHEIVWEYYSPHRAGENNELITQVFELIRLPPDFPLDWAE